MLLCTKQKKMQHQQHTPEKTNNKKQRIIHTHKTKAFFNAHTQKHKQQPNHPQNTPNQPKTTSNKKTKTTKTQNTHPTTHKKTTNHNLTNPTLHTKIYKIIAMEYQTIYTTLHKIKQARPNSLAQKQNTHIHKTDKISTQQNTNLYKTTPKQKNMNTIKSQYTQSKANPKTYPPYLILILRNNMSIKTITRKYNNNINLTRPKNNPINRKNKTSSHNPIQTTHQSKTYSPEHQKTKNPNPLNKYKHINLQKNIKKKHSPLHSHALETKPQN